MEAPVVLVLGAGPNIGQSVASYFAKYGYKVALASRSRQDALNANGELELSVDLAKPDSVSDVFGKVKAEFAVPPSVVIYNGAYRTLVDKTDPLSAFSMNDFNREMSINVTSAILAAHLAVRGFKELPPLTRKTFFYTGNKLPVMPSPQALYFGMGKVGISHMIWDCSIGYRESGFKFYFTDERFPDGRPTRDQMSGAARGKLMLELAEKNEQGPWYYTFCKGFWV